MGPEPRDQVRAGATGLGARCGVGSGRAVAQQRRRRLRTPLAVRGEVERRRAVVRRGVGARAARKERGDHLVRLRARVRARVRVKVSVRVRVT